MKNIKDILNGVGIEIPAEKQEAFNKLFNENYKTIAEYTSLNTKLEAAKTSTTDLETKYNEEIKKRDDDLAKLNAKLTEAGNDATKLNELDKQFKDLKLAYDTDKKSYEDRLQNQSYDFLVKETTTRLKFSSNSAKKAFLSDLLEKPLQIRDDKLVGFDDFVATYKEQDAGAFVSEDSEKQSETLKAPIFASKNKDEGNKAKPEAREIPKVW